MAPAAAWSRSRSSPGRARMVPLYAVVDEAQLGVAVQAVVAMRRVDASIWLAIVSSLACCSEETRA